ncbi:hypothetical protein DFJ73DRAFT_144802 [Zopfochytrium polystomum]|nr:hypothetical protein DFJ73DRAFT_144802 [Zopfochytrium polystomum]
MATGKRVPSNGIPRHMSRINESVKSLKEEMEIMDDQLHATASLLGMDSSFTALDAETLASLQSSLESPHAPDWISSLMANTSSTGKLDPSSGSFGTTEALLSGFGSNDVHDLATVLETLAPLNQQGTVPRTEDAWDQKIRAHGQTRSQSATDGQNAGAGNMPTSLAALGVLHPPGKADAVRLPARSPVAPALGQTLSIALDGDDAIYADDFADLVMEDADSIDLGLL